MKYVAVWMVQECINACVFCLIFKSSESDLASFCLLRIFSVNVTYKSISKKMGLQPTG